MVWHRLPTQPIMPVPTRSFPSSVTFPMWSTLIGKASRQRLPFPLQNLAVSLKLVERFYCQVVLCQGRQTLRWQASPSTDSPLIRSTLRVTTLGSSTLPPAPSPTKSSRPTSLARPQPQQSRSKASLRRQWMWTAFNQSPKKMRLSTTLRLPSIGKPTNLTSPTRSPITVCSRLAMARWRSLARSIRSAYRSTVPKVMLLEPASLFLIANCPAVAWQPARHQTLPTSNSTTRSVPALALSILSWQKATKPPCLNRPRWSSRRPIALTNTPRSLRTPMARR